MVIKRLRRRYESWRGRKVGPAPVSPATATTYLASIRGDGLRGERFRSVSRLCSANLDDRRRAVPDRPCQGALRRGSASSRWGPDLAPRRARCRAARSAGPGRPINDLTW